MSTKEELPPPIIATIVRPKRSHSLSSPTLSGIRYPKNSDILFSKDNSIINIIAKHDSADFTTSSARTIDSQVNNYKAILNIDTTPHEFNSDQWAVSREDIEIFGDLFKRISQRPIMNPANSDDRFEVEIFHENSAQFDSKLLYAHNQLNHESDNSVTIKIGAVGAAMSSMSASLLLLGTISGKTYIANIVAIMLFIGGLTFIAMQIAQQRSQN